MKKILLSLLVLSLIITGCSKNNDNKKESSNENKNVTKLSCYSDVYLFHSKKYVEHIISYDEDNKLVGYEYIEKYYEFDETGGDFNLICDVSPEEAENNNKMYKYKKEVAECNRDNMEVKITDTYDISKLESKKYLPDVLEDNLDDNYVFDVDNYKNAISSKGYICEER